MQTFSRRALMGAMTTVGLAAQTAAQAKATPAPLTTASYPLRQVRLKPSPFLTAIEANQRYLLSLESDRFLHNFRAGAGLDPKGKVYGGWEARGIAGHSLGHYLSALSLIYAQTGDVRFRERAAYILAELKTIQAKHGDGYAGGTTVTRDGKEVDGKVVFEEIRKGDIRTKGFDLNGGWVPVYTYHKVFAGALDAHLHAGLADGLSVAQGLGDYFGTIIEGLSDAQVQEILRAEHGGITESYAELYALTGAARWKSLAERLRHKAIVDALAEGRDDLAGKHANTQIPKIVGSARLYELTQNQADAKTALFFFETVTKDHSYAIGGNSEYEHFGKPKQLSARLGQQTCECCNSYNMLRLTRHLYGWSGDAAYFDYFERAHLNHIMAQQDPQTGMFIYFTPLMPSFRRVYSNPTEDFWCCVGSGMESHAKHGESIYWKRGNRTIVNLYYASTLDASEAKLDMDTAFPHGDTVTITVRKAPRELALRVPGWATAATVTVNGKAAGKRDGGYLILTGLKSGDRVDLKLPMPVRVEAIPDDPRLIAFVSGPLVLAADYGPDSQPFDSFDPVAVTDAATPTLTPAGGLHSYTLADQSRPKALMFKPFYAQRHNRSAVYIRHFGQAEWVVEEPKYLAAAEARSELQARTIDVIRLGEQQPETDHAFQGTANTQAISHISDPGRVVQKGYFEFDLATTPGPLVLQVSYSANDRNKDFRLLIDGQLLTSEKLEGPRGPGRNVKTYDLPLPLTRGKAKLRVRFEADKDQWAAVYEARLLRLKAGTA
ncbi:glycoside hydrolase family 127 protein [Asticcacaulis sp. YBE204]|uniref:glycoside hydrolase family 127 protein n=1 Tax=Asticcacaulis sp. YBE204 TaxID=1282363 RepID=UPI0003C4078B|nr:glycoside hydrolase family 127 protein [Asticcacaulis sp. YBE204]ESQ79686.1 hypothetical protein AEYBE204_07535 [Asticcacaulis sp. YBE204]